MASGSNWREHHNSSPSGLVKTAAAIPGPPRPTRRSRRARWTA